MDNIQWIIIILWENHEYIIVIISITIIKKNVLMD